MDHISHIWRATGVLLVFLLLAPTARAATYYVDDDVTGGDGSSWASAFRYLQDALAVAVAGDEIHVAAGIYYPDEGGGQSNNDRYATFQLKSGVAVYGGYPNGGDTRDWTTNVTILSGDIDQNDSTGGDNSGNSYHVVNTSGTNSAARLDGFSIINGNADDDTASSSYAEGGGLYNSSGSPILNNLIFSDNRGIFGGGMVNTGNSSPSLSNITFTANSGNLGGGGISNFGRPDTMTTISLDTVIFEGNSATLGSGMLNAFSSSSLNNVTFHANSDGAAMDTFFSSEATLNNVIFSNNVSPYDGGGMANSDSSLTLNNVTFSNNQTTGSGGGMINSNSSPTLNNVVFLSNIALQGGGLANMGNSNPVLNQVTFNRNRSFFGGAIMNDGSNPVIRNSIIWNNYARISDPSIHNVNGGAANVSYSIVQFVFGGTGNSMADPLFKDPSSGDLRPITISPAVNAGNNALVPTDLSTDLDGNPRIAAGTVDMGAYEHQGGTLALTISPRSTLGNVSGDSLNCGINGSNCTTEYSVGATVNLTATGKPGYAFSSWSGGCSDSFTINTAMTCSANFTPTCYSVNSVVYVDHSANGSETGEDWTNAINSLRDALNFAEQCPNVSEIRVARGTYRGAAFEIPDSLAVYGGYPNGGGAARDWVTNETVLSRDTIGHVVGIRRGDVVLDGFTIAGGKEGIYMEGGNATLNNMIIRDTSSMNVFLAGAGILIIGGDLTLNNVIFVENSGGYGGFFVDDDAMVTLNNTVFYGNPSDFGSGGINNESGTVTVNNSILWGNTSPNFNTQIYTGASATTNVTHSIVQGGHAGTGNLDTDPLFVNAAGGDLRLQSTSPAIDTGDSSLVTTTLDLDANPRIHGCTVDMGAYENQSAVCSSYALTFVKPLNGTVSTLRFNGTFVVPNEIQCGSAGTRCSKRFSNGANLTLIPTPDSGFNFVGWGGDCSASSINIDADKYCTASFMGEQSIDFSPPASSTYGGSDTLSATATSGLPVSLASTTPGVCGVATNIVIYHGLGICTITADQAGDDNYFPAPQVSADITVARAEQMITLNLPSGAIAGGSGIVNVVASSSLPVTLGTTTPAVCSVSGTTVSYLSAGTCTLTADQPGDANYNPAPRVSGDIPVIEVEIFQDGFES